MKIFLLFTMILLVAGCSKNIVMKDSTIQADPQYLEEIKIEQKDDSEIIAELQNLQNIQSDLYHVSPGDKFNIYVYDESDLDTEGIIVKPDGAISFKLIGEVQVSGLTVAEATAKIEERLKAYIHYPKVSMIPYELTGAKVTIMGKIVNPGCYEIQNNTRVLDIIATAGGLASGYFQNNTVELADLERSYVVRKNRILPVDFVELVRKGDMLQNIPLVDGDYIYIPSSVNREIYVIGEVIAPGHFLFKESMTVMQVISFAQGFKETSTSEIAVIRGGMNHPRIFKINFKSILKGETRDFPLKPNDIVYVPRSKLAEWNKMIGLITPSLELIQGGWMVKEIFKK